MSIVTNIGSLRIGRRLAETAGRARGRQINLEQAAQMAPRWGRVEVRRGHDTGSGALTEWPVR